MWAFLSDGLGIVAGSMMGTTPLTVFIESAAGIEDGGRTGLTGAACGALLPLGRLFWHQLSRRGHAAKGSQPRLVWSAIAARPKEGATSPVSWACAAAQLASPCALLPHALPAAITVSFFFFVSLFFSPILASIPPYATGPAMVLVGTILLGHIAHIEWDNIGHAIPAFLTIILMPFTYSGEAAAEIWPLAAGM